MSVALNLHAPAADDERPDGSRPWRNEEAQQLEGAGSVERPRAYPRPMLRSRQLRTKHYTADLAHPRHARSMNPGGTAVQPSRRPARVNHEVRKNGQPTGLSTSSWQAQPAKACKPQVAIQRSSSRPETRDQGGGRIQARNAYPLQPFSGRHSVHCRLAWARWRAVAFRGAEGPPTKANRPSVDAGAAGTFLLADRGKDTH